MFKLTGFWLRSNLKQGRQVVAYALILVLAIINAFIYTSRYAQDNEIYNNMQREYGERFEGASASPDALTDARFFLPLPPRELKFLVDSKIESVPSVINLSAERTRMPNGMVGTASSFLNFDAVDLAFIIEVILSFLAIVLTYDAVCGERQQGTLKMLLANGVARSSIYISKLIAAVIALAIPLLLGLVVNALAIQFLGGIPLSGSQIAVLAGFFGASLLLVLLFAALGITVSAMVRSPVTSLVMLLLIWVLVVIVLPGSAKLTGKVLTPVRSPEEYQRIVEEMGQNYMLEGFEAGAMTRPPQMAQADGFTGEKIMNEYNERLISELNNIKTEQLQQLYRQADTISMLTRISPTGLFRQAVSRLADNDLTTLTDFFDQGERYRDALFSAIREADSRDNDSPHLLYMEGMGSGGYVSIKPFGTAPPRFEWRRMSLAERAAQALPDLLALLLLSAVLVFVGVIALNRYDAR